MVCSSPFPPVRSFLLAANSACSDGHNKGSRVQEPSSTASKGKFHLAVHELVLDWKYANCP